MIYELMISILAILITLTVTYYMLKKLDKRINEEFDRIENKLNKAVVISDTLKKI